MDTLGFYLEEKNVCVPILGFEEDDSDGQLFKVGQGKMNTCNPSLLGQLEGPTGKSDSGLPQLVMEDLYLLPAQAKLFACAQGFHKGLFSREAGSIMLSPVLLPLAIGYFGRGKNPEGKAFGPGRKEPLNPAGFYGIQANTEDPSHFRDTNIFSKFIFLFQPWYKKEANTRGR